MSTGMNRVPSIGIRGFLGFAGSRYWMASLLPALVGTTLPFWLRPPGFSFRLPAAVEFLLATLLFHAGFSFLITLFEGRRAAVWQKPRLWMFAGFCISAACLLGLELNSSLILHHGVSRNIFIIYGLATLFVGALYVVPPLCFHRRVVGEIVAAEGLILATSPLAPLLGKAG